MSVSPSVRPEPFVSDLKTELVEVPINLNGALSVRVPRGMSGKDAQMVATSLLNTLLAQVARSRPSRDGVTLEAVDGECWVEGGQVLVGDLAFEVDHDARRGTSQATVDLVPDAGAYGAKHLYARVTTVTERDQVAVTATNPLSGVEEPLVAIAIDHGEVVVHVWNQQAGKEHGGGPMASVRRAGLTMMRH